MTAFHIAVRTTARMVVPYAPGTCDALLEFRVAEPLEVRVTFSDESDAVFGPRPERAS